ncbi:hypothetical protein NKH34_25850 [Mesorhizobium sp. M1148]|uniref:hypothetical protein n=1 Tax=unclassified Mesorhizobium TaxID=325217 RepID=UPI00333A348B
MPKQRSSGGRARLFGIGERGDRYLRTFAMRSANQLQAGSSKPLACKLRHRRHSNVAACRPRQQECEDRVGHALGRSSTERPLQQILQLNLQNLC